MGRGNVVKKRMLFENLVMAKFKFATWSSQRSNTAPELRRSKMTMTIEKIPSPFSHNPTDEAQRQGTGDKNFRSNRVSSTGGYFKWTVCKPSPCPVFVTENRLGKRSKMRLYVVLHVLDLAVSIPPVMIKVKVSPMSCRL
ncbi:uncharacterized protein MEPE_01591 [Melanopsichium pennsylvanicum]|uniref:Uncharacterized protein n=1 Tax=Melanopsichium pennsylvanicum TaxID=63383 RepID=A0AAJ4XIQ4_9BASI|nr:uncharacterized protein MEPE_01591 [Melanopsichium pennsylvanicum]